MIILKTLANETYTFKKGAAVCLLLGVQPSARAQTEVSVPSLNRNMYIAASTMAYDFTDTIYVDTIPDGRMMVLNWQFKRYL